jgi:hypothetical protein
VRATRPHIGRAASCIAVQCILRLHASARRWLAGAEPAAQFIAVKLSLAESRFRALAPSTRPGYPNTHKRPRQETERAIYHRHGTTDLPHETGTLCRRCLDLTGNRLHLLDGWLHHLGRMAFTDEMGPRRKARSPGRTDRAASDCVFRAAVPTQDRFTQDRSGITRPSGVAVRLPRSWS